MNTENLAATMAAIDRFVASSAAPVLIEPGEDALPVSPATFRANARGAAVVIECWNATRNLVRCVRGIASERRGRLELSIERFGSRTGTLALVDLADPSNRDATRRGARLKYRERFRRSLARQFPDWRIAELSVEPDLHHSLSPSFPRALLRKGDAGIAAIGAAEDALAPEGVLSFGLIWLDHLRKREKRLFVETLAVFAPVGAEATTCHRVRLLNPQSARYLVFVHSPGVDEDRIDPGDYTNFNTRLDACRRPLAESRVELREWIARITRIDGVEARAHVDGSVSLAVRGLEFARASGDELLFGLDRRADPKGPQTHIAGGEAHVAEIEQIAATLARMRAADAPDRTNPLYTRQPEAWLEAQVRASIEQIDATLHPSPVYGQVPQFASGDRGVIDLLAADRDGRLAILEIKAAQDIHLPLQALDYWMRVKWHLERDEFSRRAYFPGMQMQKSAPRLLLVAPALDFHPSNEIVLAFFSPEVQAERVGVGIEWRRDLRVMFRAPASSWPSQFSAR